MWSTGQRQWVLGQESGPVRTDETFTAYTDQQSFEACAGDPPQPEQRRVPDYEPSCDLGGVTSWDDVWTTAYVWDRGAREWVLGYETGPVRADQSFTAYNDAEFLETCAADQPDAEERRVPISDPSCDLGGVTSWTDVYTTGYV